MVQQGHGGQGELRDQLPPVKATPDSAPTDLEGRGGATAESIYTVHKDSTLDKVRRILPWIGVATVIGFFGWMVPALMWPATTQADIFRHMFPWFLVVLLTGWMFVGAAATLVFLISTPFIWVWCRLKKKRAS